MERMSAAVFGTVCCDEIRRPGRNTEFGFGGLFYNLISLAQLFGNDGTVVPICKVGSRDYSAIVKQFTRYPAININYIQQYPGRNNTVLLDYYSDEERIEYSTNLPEPFTMKELLPVPDVRLYMVNFISGIDMQYRTFCAIRRRLKIPLFVDLHSIFLGFKPNGKRYYLRNRDWSRWHESGDIVHLNQIEAQMLAGRTLDSEKEFLAFGYFLLDRSTSVVLITKGGEGSLVLWRSGNRSLHKSVPAYHYGALCDPTGCGDVFSAAYVYAHLQGGDPFEAADFASKVAGVRAAHNSSTELHNLRKVLEEKGIF